MSPLRVRTLSGRYAHLCLTGDEDWYESGERSILYDLVASDPKDRFSSFCFRVKLALVMAAELRG